MTDDELKRLFEEMRHGNSSAQAQSRRHLDVTAEGLRTEIRAVAEAVAAFDEKVERGNGDLREEMRRGFADTQVMIRF